MIFDFIRRIMIPITKEVGKVHAPYSKKLIHAYEYHSIRNSILPGSVLISRTEGELSNLFIPGNFSHAAIAVDKDYIVEAVGSGVRKSSLLDFCISKDYIAILNPLFVSVDGMQKAAEFSLEELGKPYDYQFEPNSNAFYCAELIGYLYNKVLYPKPSPFILRKTLGVETYIPQDFWDSKTKFKCVWTNVTKIS